jgi:molybdopterin converting factor small subunit
VAIGVRLFAGIRREAGVGELTLELSAGATVTDALAALAAGPLPFLDPDSGFATAVNREYTPGATRLADGDELALVPPISGG